MMRAALVLASFAAACTHPPPHQPVPVPAPHVVMPSFAVAPELATKLQSGFPIQVELRIASATELDAVAVGSCRIMFDLWDEVFVVRAGATHTKPRSVDDAMATCFDTAAFERARDAAAAGNRPFSGIVVAREFEPLPARAAVNIERGGIWCGMTTELWREPAFDPAAK